MAALRPGPGVGTHRTMSAPPTERGQSLTERERDAREASLATAREAARLLAVRIARDKGTGRPASWFEGRREDQPFCGLTNEGATCYLNSLIQALFLLPEVRREVFAFSYEGEAVHGLRWLVACRVVSAARRAGAVPRALHGTVQIRRRHRARALRRGAHLDAPMPQVRSWPLLTSDCLPHHQVLTSTLQCLKY